MMTGLSCSMFRSPFAVGLSQAWPEVRHDVHGNPQEGAWKG